MISERAIVSMVVAAALVAALIVAPAAAARTITANGTNVFVGEENLDFAGGVFAGTTQFVHYTGEVGKSSIDKTIVVTGGVVDELVKGIPTGHYYAIGSANPTQTYVNVQNPEATLDVMLSSSPKDSVNGKSISRDTSLNFKFYSNVDTGATANVELTLPGGGVVRTYDGKSLSFNANGQTQYLSNVLFGQNAEAGTYTAVAKWDRSTDFYGKGFDSRAVTFEVVTRTLAITANKDTVVRGNSFTVTVTGEARKDYRLYVREIGGVAPGTYPVIAPGQIAVNYAVPGENDTYRTVRTNAGGTATVQFNTSQSTGEWRFTIRVEDPAAPEIYDEARVRVERGAVTIALSGTGTYAIGEVIILSGTCSDSNTVYLFLTGPNIDSNGLRFEDINTGVIGARVQTGNESTFTRVAVEADDTWTYRWDTSRVKNPLDAGGYTIYAVSAPRGKDSLSGVPYSTASFNLRAPSLTATVSGATLAKGDGLTIAGTATGNPANVCVWIFGENYRKLQQLIPIGPDGAFEYRLAPVDTAHLPSGQYSIVIQHPADDVFDVWASGTLLTGNGITPVDLATLQAAAAANALITALDSPNIDDIYAKFTVVVEEPYVRIDPIGNQTAGSAFTISGTTNLAVGDALAVQVVPAVFDPGNNAGVAGVAIVLKGDGANTWSFEVGATDLGPDRYEVAVESFETGASRTAAFNVLEGHEPPPSGPALTLSPGWNFVSIPRPLAAGNDTAAIFAGVKTDNRSILRYDTAAGDWTALDKEDRIGPLEGIWLYSTRPAAVPLNFSTVLPVPPAERALLTGWNAVGVTGTAPATARDALLSVKTQWTTLIGFDAGTQAFETGIVNGGSKDYVDSRLVYQGKGYWLHMTGPGTLCAVGA